jgi:superfamily II DNA or RNA helicase
MKIALRDYQDDVINACRASYKSGKKAPLLVLPTGAGKTICFSFMAHSASNKGSNVLILVHRQELVYQTSEKLSFFGLDHGIISPEFPHTDHPVQIAMVQTLSKDKRLSKSKKPDLLIIDEAHHSMAKGYRKVIDWAQSTVLGVTATPCRLDGMGLGNVFDDIVIGVTVDYLIRRKFLSDYLYYGFPYKKSDRADAVTCIFSFRNQSA